MNYIVRWTNPTTGRLQERKYSGPRAFLEARLKHESLVRCIPGSRSRLVDFSTGLIYCAGQWRTEEQCA